MAKTVAFTRSLSRLFFKISIAYLCTGVAGVSTRATEWRSIALSYRISGIIKNASATVGLFYYMKAAKLEGHGA
jgi:hypothetical protein